MHHLETAVGFLPEALAADRVWGLQILRLLFYFFINLSNQCSILIFFLFSFSPKRVWHHWPLDFRMQTFSHWCLSCGSCLYVSMVFYTVAVLNLQSCLNRLSTMVWGTHLTSDGYFDTNIWTPGHACWPRRIFQNYFHSVASSLLTPMKLVCIWPELNSCLGLDLRPRYTITSF